jgi:DNA-directed RNA polymerase subunit H (RpoH/RPB5)
MKSTKATSKSLQQSSEKQVKNIEEKDEKQIQSSIQNEKDTLPKIKPKNLTFIKK